MSWHLLEFNGDNRIEIDLNLTLSCGQAFRWEFCDSEWRCGFDGFIAQLKQDTDYKVYFYSKNENFTKIKTFLIDYFRCQESLSEKIKFWALSDKYFAKISKKFMGIRLLRQNPVENLFSFICSSNNNISRITKLVCALAFNFGAKQFLTGENDKSTCYSAFPSIDDLSVENLEESLRNFGFGYRAKYIKETAYWLRNNGGETRLLELRQQSFEDARKFLMNLSGVGSKVADCVLLCSLDHLEAVPIDIHMFKVMKNNYASHFDQKILNSRSVTPIIYEKVRKVFNKIWHPHPGWAQLIIFASDLNPSNFRYKKEQISNIKRHINEKSNENSKKKN